MRRGLRENRKAGARKRCSGRGRAWSGPECRQRNRRSSRRRWPSRKAMRRCKPEERERFMMEAFGAERMSAKRFSSTVGIGSRRLDLFGEKEISSRASSVVSLRKTAKRGSESATGDGKCCWIGGRPAASAAASKPERILATLAA